MLAAERGRRRARASGTFGPSALLPLLVLAVLAVPSVSAPSLGGAPSAAGTLPGSASTNNSAWCPAHPYSNAAERNLTAPDPGGTLPSGATLGVQYEVAEHATNLSPLQATAYVPTMTAVFPLRTGPAERVAIGPRSFAIRNGSWSSPSAASAAATLSAPLALRANATAFLTSARLSVMATAGWGQLTLGMRWRWTVTDPNGSVSASLWSSAGPTTGYPAYFDPAPYVTIASTSGPNGTIGSPYSVVLSGAVRQTRFFLELENATHGQANGSVLRSAYAYNLGNSTPLATRLTVLGWNGSLQPGDLLYHVRNACSSLIYSLSVHAVYPATARIRFLTTPSGCGPVQFAGRSYANGTAVTLTPSTSALKLSVGGCPGHPFSTWRPTGGFDPFAPSSASTRAWVSANGSVTAEFG